jgi:hypothetical protein
MQSIISQILQGFGTIFTSPAKDWSVLWLIAPIILFWIILEIYFDKHKKESLGWNTALGNGLSLFWVAISSVRLVVTEMFSHDITQSFGQDIFWRTFWIFAIFAYSLFIISVSFSHKMKTSFFYPLASPTPIYFLSMVIVLLSYGVLGFTWVILLDLAILYGIILGIEMLIKHFIPDSPDDGGSDPFASSSQSNDPFASPSPTPADDPFASNSCSDPFGSSSGNNSSNNDFKL